MNMKHTFSILFFSVLTHFAFAQSFTPVKDEAALRQRIEAASRNIKTIQCDFTQEKNMSMLADKAVSKGRFYFSRDSKVRLEYLQPVKNLIVMNDGRMMIQNDKKTQQMDMHRNRVFQQLNNIIVGSVNGSLFSGIDFSARFFESKDKVKVELTPLSKTIKNFISTITIVLDAKDFTAQSIVMSENSGDNTILSFSNKQLNGTVDASLFAVK